MESSRYASHLKTWQRVLGKDRVLATIYDDLREKPQSYVDKLADFIGLPRFTLAPSDIHRVHASEMMTHPRNYYRTRGPPQWRTGSRRDGSTGWWQRSRVLPWSSYSWRRPTVHRNIV